MVDGGSIHFDGMVLRLTCLYAILGHWPVAVVFLSINVLFKKCAKIIFR